MKIYFKGMVAMALGMWSVVAVAQQDRNQSIRESEKKGWEYEVKAGVNIGGASPIPLPEEIREVNSFNPKFNGVARGTGAYRRACASKRKA